MADPGVLVVEDEVIVALDILSPVDTSSNPLAKETCARLSR